ncbi:hypothetical protein AMR72_03225 [Flavobacterium psychrophilum]|nr:hypothetical protein AMR72_03225 [Flavobacterium psychrophilum]AOE51606.1 hypothetical protein ALW18_03225 [Flavobacterium psychrophilum]
MAKMFIFKRIYISVALLMLSLNTFAQQTPAVDSILKQAKLDIYEKPERVIKIGDSIYNDPKSSTEDKVMGLMLVSDAYSSKRDYQKSLRYFLTANELSKKSNDIGLQIKILTKTGVKYQQMQVYDKAIHFLDESDRLIKAHPSADPNNFTKATNSVVKGFIYKDQLNCDIAIGYFDRGIEEYKKSKTIMNQPNLSIAYYNKGNCYVLLKDLEAAKQSFREAIHYAETVNANSLKAFAQKGLGEVYYNEKEYEKAISVLQDAVTISKNVGDLVLNRGLYISLANNYLAVNNWEGYQKYNRLFLENQSIIRESERRSIGDSIDELTATNKQKLSEAKKQYYSIIAIVSLLILVSLLLLYKYQMRSKKALKMLNYEVTQIKAKLKKQ